MLTKLQSLCTFLADADPQDLRSVSFEDVCRRFYADPISVDRAFYSVFGMCGDEIIRLYGGEGANM